MMTRNRRLKTEIRAYQAATGTPYMVARRKMPTALAEVMREHPLLNILGIGAFDMWSKTAKQRRDEIAAGPEELAAQEAVVLQTAAWLRENVAPIKTPTVGSYGMKHVMERATGIYVTNGVFIAAALVAHYTFKYTPPNVLFGMSARDIKRLNQEYGSF